MTSSEHLGDEIQALLDGRLDGEARARVESHLEVCLECRGERQALSRVKRSVRTSLLTRETPGDLASGIAAMLDRQDREGAQAGAPQAPVRARSRTSVVVYASVAAAVVALIALAVFVPGRRNLPSRVAQDYANHESGMLPLQVRTEDPQALERFFAARGVSFSTRVMDLEMMGYRLEGGRVLNPDGRERAFFVYRGPKNQVLACQMYEGDVRQLPKNALLRRNDDFTFFVYRSGGTTQVFWQEGNVVCVLVSDIPAEEVIQLAFAKAMKA